MAAIYARTLVLFMVIATMCAAVLSSAVPMVDQHVRVSRQIRPAPNLSACIDLFTPTTPISQFGDWLAEEFQGSLNCAGLDTVDLLGLTTKVLVTLYFSLGCNAVLAAVPGAAILSPVLCV